MPHPANTPNRKKSLCHLLRQVAQAFIAQTDDGKPATRRESVELRNQSDSLVTLYEEGYIDPVKALQEAPLPSIVQDFDPAEQAPLTGTHG
jgi:hypothetical protein